ncbi:MAG TPA: GHMP kinase [Actinomycetota bacterium]|nr:GHMP kinase [Actinomycetota bacterium]
MMQAAVRSTAPLRISFVGGGTDFPHYFQRHGGAVLSATIDRHTHVTLVPRHDREVRIRSDLGHLVEYHLDDRPAYDGVMDLAKAAIERMGVDRGLEMHVRSDAPPGSGLGGSSALVTAIVGALAALEDRALSRAEVVRLAHAIEREDLGIAGGWQDQYAAAFGGVNLLEFSGDGVEVTPVRCGSEDLERLRRHLLLCYTGGVRTDLGLIDTQIRLYHEGREETMVGMKHLHEMAYDMRAAIEAGDLDDLGPMLRAAYENKKRMNPHIADGTPIERLFVAAREAGADGAKICGAGGGGYVLVACRPEHRTAVGAALEHLGGQLADFTFHPDGVRAWNGDRPWRPGP